MEAVAFSGQIRTELGKKPTKAVRKEGRIPAILYNKSENIHFSTTHNEVKKMIFTPEFKIAELNIDGKTHRCFIKDIQWHPVTDKIVHIDFLSLIDGHPVVLEVPVRFEGTAEGVRNGGKLQQNLRRIKIKTTPEKMVAELSLDVSALDLGQAVRVLDIKPVDGVEIMTALSTPVAFIEVPRAMRSAAAEEEEEGATTEEGATEEGATEEK